MIKHFCLLIISLTIPFLFSCDVGNGSVLPEIRINHENRTSLSLSSFVSSVEYIPLETSKASIVQDWCSVFLTDSFIVTIDDRILMFNRSDGSYVKELSKKGKGPWEYRDLIQQHGINPVNNSVFADVGKSWIEIPITGNNYQRIQKPEIGNFTIAGAFTISAINNFIQIDQDKYFAYVNNSEGDSPIKGIIFDRAGDVLKSFPNYLSYKPMPDKGVWVHSAIYYRLNGNCYFKEPYNDTVFQINNQELIPVYTYNLGKLKQDYKDQVAVSRSEYLNVNRMIETEDWVFFKYWIKHITYCGIYFKNNGRSVVLENRGDASGLINDIDGFGAFFPSDTEGSNNLIGVMPAAQLASSEAQLKICQNDQLKKLSGITVESNPLVVIAKLR